MGPTITSGSLVKVVDIHADDAYFKDKAKLTGQQCMVTTDGGGFLNAGDGYYGGGAVCSGQNYYFYKVGVELVGTMAAEKPSPKVAGTASTITEVTPDSTMKVLEIDRADAYFGDAEKIVGQTCTVTKEGMHNNGDSWYGGGAECGSAKTYYYFYKVKIEVATMAAAKPAPVATGSRYTGAPLASGKTFRVLEVSKDDAYFPDAEKIVGQTCTATKEAMLDNTFGAPGGNWYGGSAECGPEKTYYYFYKVAIEVE